jgi:hypothetical protein
MRKARISRAAVAAAADEGADRGKQRQYEIEHSPPATHWAKIDEFAVMPRAGREKAQIPNSPPDRAILEAVWTDTRALVV